MVNIKNYEKNVDLIEIDNGLNLKATLCNFGAGMYSLYFDEDPMILELSDVNGYMKALGYFNKTLGCVAGRIPAKGYLNSKEYNLKITDAGQRDFCLHGGDVDSLSFKPWKYDVKENNKAINVIFKIQTKNLENGFLGRASIKVIYSFSKISNKFTINFKANVLDDCLLNLSNHIYWNFARSKDLSEYRLKFNSSKVAAMRDDLLFVGVEDIPAYIDFRRSKKIKTSNDFIRKNVKIGTIDNTFIFDDKVSKVYLKNDKYDLVLKTDYPAMNIYLDNSLSEYNFNNRDDFGYMRAIALEPQLFLLDKDSITFNKGDKYDKKIEYTIKRVGK